MLDELQAERHELLLKLVDWAKTATTNQAALAKKNQKLRTRVGMLETRCELQDAEIALLDARVTAACGMLNLE